MTEEWRPVVGYKGMYEVSDGGMVRSLDRIDSSGHRIRGKLLKQSVGKSGRGYTTLCKNGVAKRIFTHKIVLSSFIGSCPPGYQCRHLDGDHKNNCLKNIRWGTAKENGEDKVRLNEASKGEDHWNSKLNEEKVRAIKTLYKKTEATQKDLADLFDVHYSTIHSIVRDKGWQWVVAS